MTRLQLILRSVRHYWRTNLAVVLGVIIGTAVIGGALVVGDSVRNSLREMTLRRLGRIDLVMHSPRFFRQAFVDEVQGQHHMFSGGGLTFAPAIWLSGSLEAGDRDSVSRVTSANVVGLNEQLWQMIDTGGLWPPKEREVVLGARVAASLKVMDKGELRPVEVGDELTLWVEIPESVPRETLLGEREEISQEIAVTVSSILAEEDGASRLDLAAGQQLPLTVYVDLTYLQESIGLDEVRPSRRNPLGVPARVNTMFAAVNAPTFSTEAHEQTVMGLLPQMEQLAQVSLRPADLGLRVRVNEDRRYLSFESDSMVLDEPSVEAIRQVVSQISRTKPPPFQRGTMPDPVARRMVEPLRNPVSVHLANQIANAEDDTGGDDQADRCYSTYSVVAGITMSDTAPFGPFEFDGDAVTKLADDEILLNEWLAEDAQVGAGDQVRVRYYLVGSEGEGADGGLKEVSAVFNVVGVVKLGDTPAADQFFTPHVPGITDADSISNWEEPFAMDKDRITDRDEDYWELFKTTPKAFVNLSVAERLWGTRHGKLSSIRVAVSDGVEPEAAAEAARTRAILDPDLRSLGMSLVPIKLEGLKAAVGANDFTGLFVGFSFFLIAAAAILIGLLFRLSIDRRATDVGLLSTIGMTEKSVQRVFLGEGVLLVAAGIVPGMIAAIGYAAIMMYGLRTWWIGATGTRFLALSVEFGSLLIACAISAVVSLLAVWLSVRRLRNYSARDLLTGGADETALTAFTSSQRRSLVVFVGCAGAGGGLLAATAGGVVPGREAFGGLTWQVVCFFVSALALLAAGVTGLGVWFQRNQLISVLPGAGAISRLGLRNASRHRSRSLFTVGLIAFAAFVIVAVAAGRRNPSVEDPDLNSGNGGFTLVAESSQPLLHDPNLPDGRDKLGFSQNAKWPEGVTIHRLRMKPGEDGSCLNLYQTRVPTVLGVPDAMVQRGGFRFADTPSETPWKLLQEDGGTAEVDYSGPPSLITGVPTVRQETVPVFPVIGDMNTLQFGLKKGIGDLIPVPSAEKAEFALRVVGMLDSSVFQGVLLMSEENFRELYPEAEGYRYFLVETKDDAQAAAVSTMLETELTPYGLDVERVADRIAGFLAVQNTYLSTFQTLGALGLLLGTLGLGTVMLRNIIERRSELALIRTVGFPPSKVVWLVLVENALLLLFGLGLGTACALLAMTPHLQKTGADVPWGSLALIVSIVFVVGMLSARFAVREAVRTPLLSTLRAE